MTLVTAHALLHRETRDRDDQERIVATLRDYAIVRELAAELFAEGVDATVKPETREAVDAIAALKQAVAKDEVSLAEIAKALTLDKSAASRRVADAMSRGYLVNAETRKGKPARISLGDPMPAEVEILPHPDRLRDRCSVAALPAGGHTSSPPIDKNDPAEIPAFADEVIE